MYEKGRNNKSLFEKSMQMAISIAKVSAFSIAKMGLPEHPEASKKTKKPPATSTATRESLLPQFPRSMKSEKPQNSSKPVSFLMQPAGGGGGGETEASYVIREDNSVNDKTFSDYIRKVHEKNRRSLYETAEYAAFAIPPPPRAAVKQMA